MTDHAATRSWRELRLDDPDTVRRWDRTLDAHAVASRFLRPAWAALYGRAYHMPVRCFGVDGADGQLDLILPLARVRSLLFGDSWIGLPFVTEAGVWWNPDTLSPALLHRTLKEVQEALGRPVDLRNGPDAAVGHGTALGAHKAVFHLDLPGDPEALWRALPAPRRRQVKRAEKAGYRVEAGGVELLGGFHAVYSENMRDLGSPPHARGFFALALEALGDHGRVLVVRAPDGAPAAAGLFVRHGMRLENPWVGARRRFRADAPNMLLFQRGLAHAIETGCTVFDFGRSTVGSGQAAFKAQWGARPVPVHWTRIGGAGPASDVARPGRAAGLVSAVWSRLPLWAVRAVGPHLIRRIPA